MRKIIFLISIISVLLITNQVRAEISAQAYSGSGSNTSGEGILNTEQQVFVYAKNDSGATVATGQIVVLAVGSDTVTGTEVGTFFTTTTTADNRYVFGVVSGTEAITDDKVGKICIRGPHIVETDNSVGTHVIGNILATSTTAGKATVYSTSDGTTGGQLGIVIGDYATEGSDYVTVWVNPQVHR